MEKRKQQPEMIWELITKISYLCLALCTFNSFLYASSVQPLFVKGTLLLSVGLILLRIVKYRKYSKMPCLVLMLLFCASFAFSALMNRQYGIIDNGKWIIWTGIQFFALYLCDIERDTVKYRREFQILAHIMVLYSIMAAAISLGMLVVRYSKLLETTDGEFLVSGFTWGRLWGVYTDPNYGAVFSVVVMILSLLFLIQKKGFIRILYIVSILLNYLYLIFSDSRTGEIALACSLAVFLYLWLKQKQKEKQSLVRYGTALLAAVLVSAVMLGGTYVIKAEYNQHLAPVFVKMFPAKTVKQTVQKKTDQVKKKVGRKKDLEQDISNGRFDLWKSAIEVWKTSPVYGTGYSTFVSYAKEHTPDTYAVNNSQGDYTSMHNAFLNTLAFQGLIGFVLLLLIAGRIISYVFLPVFQEQGEEALEHGAMLACLGAVAAAMLFLLEGTYTNSPGSFVLWTFSGYLVQSTYKKRHQGLSLEQK